MASQQERQELDTRARQGETVVPGGTGGKSLEAQEHLAEGRSRGGQTRREQLGTEGYRELGHRGGSRWGVKGIKRWVPKEVSAPLTSLEEKEPLRKGSKSTSPGTKLEAN